MLGSLFHSANVWNYPLKTCDLIIVHLQGSVGDIIIHVRGIGVERAPEKGERGDRG